LKDSHSIGIVCPWFWIHLLSLAFLILEFGYNALCRLESLTQDSGAVHSGENLLYLNLDGNELSHWISTSAALQSYGSLRTLILTMNRIGAIPKPPNPRQLLPQITHLVISFNLLSSWSDFDHLAEWLPRLTNLSAHDNPILSETIGRQLVIPRISSLLSLNGSVITSKERTDCELFYLTWVVQNGPSDDEERNQQHPQWQILCERHGRPSEHQGTQKGDALGSRLISLKVVRLNAPPTTGTPSSENNDPINLKTLPTLVLRGLRMKIGKMLTIGSAARSRGRTQLWLETHDGGLTELESGWDNKELDWVGIEDGTTIYVLLQSL